ncbi:unnamed protein product [Effrenium voratum]|uniref:Calpain catalytic domain-containing protein n=1 Tax=Effrenium voratum TaxID=2562239 RepID=A0AA36ND36_9DINO|nr:unnamed protein product [Effrenium voratum]
MGAASSRCRTSFFEDEFRVDDSRFIDPAFPPVPSSLGEPKAGRLFITEEQRQKTRWIRLPELLHFNQEISTSELEQRGQSELAWKGMSASDLAQGHLGNCWLVASIATIVKRPTWIRKLFVEADLVAGRFVIQLYDMAAARWEMVEVDDFVPCTLEDDWSEVPYAEQEDGTRVYNYNDIYTKQGTKALRKRWVPLFGRPKGRQVWALILEKAMAKFVGSYANLSGGTEPFALMALTGFPLVYVFQRPPTDRTETAARPNHWQWRGAQYHCRTSTGIGSQPLPVPDDLLDEELWPKLLQYMQRRCPVTTSITRFAAVASARDYYRQDGLISGHAYAMLDAREVQLTGRSLRLVALKNPHGDWKADGGSWSCTWAGDWGHESICWQRHPEVAIQLERGGAVSFQPGLAASPASPTQAALMSESCFWMPWDGFTLTFDKLCVLPKPLSEDPAVEMSLPATIPTVQRGASPSAAAPELPGLAQAPQALRRELRQVTVIFDPYLTMPDFLEDGSLETRLCWEATKPNHLHTLLEANRKNGEGPLSSYVMLRDMVMNLGLEGAAEPGGYQGCRCRWQPKPRASLKALLPPEEEDSYLGGCVVA